MTANIGIVLIGRNEGERLVACLQSLPAGVPCVYVDSGSTDQSVAAAKTLGAAVVSLKPTRFSAAHARNEGARLLLERHPATQWIQFLDGDCVLRPGWLETARSFLMSHPDHAVVCGRRRERHPAASVFNRLCDLEWDTPIGEADACGGDAMMRRDAFLAVGGFRDDMIAGEEPELCVRLRRLGGRIARLDAEMTLHDAAMTRPGQWWRRAVRAGHAFAEGNALHPQELWRRECRGIVAWGLILPVAILAAGFLISPWLFGLAGIYLLQMAKIFMRSRRRWPARDASIYSVACVLAKFPQAQGWLRYYVNHWRRRPSRIIEYKAEATS